MFEARRSTSFRELTFKLLAGVAGLYVATNAANAQFASVINLSTLDGTTGFRLDGVSSFDSSGFSVSDAGDVNGDGFADVIVGATGADNNAYNSGSSYVVFGKAIGFASVLNLSSLNGSNGFRLDGAAGIDYSGNHVGPAGDINGDGFDDVLIGTYRADPNGLATSGSSYVVFGKATSFASAVSLSSLDGLTGFRLDGVAASDRSGYSASSAGDVNGDGFADLIIGAYGADPNGNSVAGSSYVVFGKAAGFLSAVNLSTLNGTTGFRLDGVASNDRMGFAVSSAGDVNGDGFGDVIVGADGADPNTISQAGSSYVVFGKASGFASVINLSTLNGATGFRLDGVASVDRSGRAVASAGDANGDGFTDLIVGAYQADPNSISQAGSSYVVFGKAGGFASAFSLSTLNGASGFRLDGVATLDYAGRSVSSAGDVNGDGFADSIVSAFGADPNGNSLAGSSYVVFGKAGGFASAFSLSTLNGASGFRLDGVAPNERSGRSVSSAGDVNGDGFDDVVVGAFTADSNFSDSGSTYVIFGRAPDSSTLRAGSRAKQTIQGGAFADALVASSSFDTLEGRELGDILVGDVATTASYLHAASGVTVNLANPAGNVGDALGDSYFGISNLEGSGFADTLTGDGKPNRLTGGKGKDTKKGGNGKDTFAYRLSIESPPGAANADVIADFNPGTSSSVVDKIDLSAIDARTSVGGNQAFTFRGTKAFNGAGQVRLKKSGANVIVQGNTGGSTAPEFEIVLKGLASKIGRITIKDFKL